MGYEQRLAGNSLCSLTDMPLGFRELLQPALALATPVSANLKHARLVTAAVLYKIPGLTGGRPEMACASHPRFSEFSNGPFMCLDICSVS